MTKRKKRPTIEDIEKDRIKPGQARGGRHKPDGFVIKDNFRGPLANDDPAETTNPHWKPNGVPQR